MPVEEFPEGANVSVRAAEGLPWRDGVSNGLTPDGKCYQVSLLEPFPTANEWEGITRRYGGSELVSNVQVHTQVEALVPDQLIKAR